MDASEPTANGFFLALRLLDSLGVRYDADALLACLAEVARGETTLFDSAGEELARLEGQRGSPASPAERAEFFALFADRGLMDAAHQPVAGRVLAFLAGHERS